MGRTGQRVPSVLKVRVAVLLVAVRLVAVLLVAVLLAAAPVLEEPAAVPPRAEPGAAAEEPQARQEPVAPGRRNQVVRHSPESSTTRRASNVE